MGAQWRSPQRAGGTNPPTGLHVIPTLGWGPFPHSPQTCSLGKSVPLGVNGCLWQVGLETESTLLWKPVICFFIYLYIFWWHQLWLYEGRKEFNQVTAWIHQTLSFCSELVFCLNVLFLIYYCMHVTFYSCWQDCNRLELWQSGWIILRRGASAELWLVRNT